MLVNNVKRLHEELAVIKKSINVGGEDRGGYDAKFESLEKKLDEALKGFKSIQG
jgi:hypothetical protein